MRPSNTLSGIGPKPTVRTAVAESEGESNRLGYYRVVVKHQRDDTVALFRGTAYKTKNEHSK